MSDVCGKRESQVQDSIDRLGAISEELSSKIVALGGRLAGVLRKSCPDPQKTDPNAPAPLRVELSQAIETNCDRIGQEIRNIQSMIERLEL